MATNWQNYMAYYVIPYIGQRAVQGVGGSVCDALSAKRLSEGRIKAKQKTPCAATPVHVRYLRQLAEPLPCRPYRYDAVR